MFRRTDDRVLQLTRSLMLQSSHVILELFFLFLLRLSLQIFENLIPIEFPLTLMSSEDLILY